MSQTALPEGFRDLEAFVERWARATERERNHQSWTATQDELQSFYDAMLPRMAQVLAHLNQHHPATMPDDTRRLSWLSLSLVEATLAVEMQRNRGHGRRFGHERFVPRQ